MPKSLLLADDSVTIQKVVGISFANEDIEITTVDNGRDAVAKARAIRPDIILADVVMPGMSGYEVCETIKSDPNLDRLDKQHYTVIPPSGKLRDLVKEFPHIFETLGCRILHLLPVNPTPTTYARFGRYGSPYAAEDLTMIDPALVEFDRRSTGVEQFQELTYSAHCRGGRVLLDMVVNHTGWGSTLQENHPEWFLRKENGVFISPGAWGTTWEDLVELDHRMPLS